MFNSQMPHLDELPSSRQLVRSTLLAAAGAGALLVAVVLPAEYGVDPTGIGRVLGLTEMGEIKMQLAAEADAADAAADAAPVQSTEGSAAPAPAAAAPAAADAGAMRDDQMQVSLAPGEAAEIKVAADEGTRIAFDWSVSGGHVNYDTHGDAPGLSYHGYGKGTRSTGERGTLIAAFGGSHGWFWRNRSDGPVTVTLRTEGGYSEIKRVV
ncbi:MAG: transmembrane anchor protein [Pseudomonadota bacterium]|nr:transmembrane anchor protein [Pseudomonadota bacterium]